MSQEKRPHVEVSGNNLESAGDGGPMGSDDDVEELSIPGFDSLPDEMLVEVFSYLGHTDKLFARLVSKRWCEVITSWTGFKNSVVFLVEKGKKGMKTLSNSNSCFTSIRFKGFDVHRKGLKRFRVLDGVANHIESLEFFQCPYTWTALKRVITLFSNVKALCIKDCEPKTKEDPSTNGKFVALYDELLQDQWATFVQKLQRLRVELWLYSDLASIFLPFKGLSNLVALELGQGECQYDDLDDNGCTAALEFLYQTIIASRETLQTLVITIMPSSFLERFFPEVLFRLYIYSLLAGNSKRQCFKLTTFDLRHLDEVPREKELRYLKILLSFVRTQKNLLHVTLPKSYGDPFKEQQILMASLPRTVRSLRIEKKDYLVPNFLNMFPDLTQLEIDSEIFPYVTIGNKYVKMSKLKIICGIAPASVPGWVTAFPNLTELDLSEIDPLGEMKAFNDLAMQAIIINLKMLRSLVIGSCCDLTDYGVTGIRNEYCKYLFETRTLYMNKSLKVPSRFVTGVPLCSLTGLNKLAFVDSVLDITDVGIYFGFCFNELRSLKMTCNVFRSPTQMVTDWGLDCLGNYNPNLEEINLDFISESSVSPVGLRRLLKRLPRLKDDRQNLDKVNFHRKVYDHHGYPILKHYDGEESDSDFVM